VLLYDQMVLLLWLDFLPRHSLLRLRRQRAVVISFDGHSTYQETLRHKLYKATVPRKEDFKECNTISSPVFDNQSHPVPQSFQPIVH
jgi:hypothetical protein